MAADVTNRLEEEGEDKAIVVAVHLFASILGYNVDYLESEVIVLLEIVRESRG